MTIIDAYTHFFPKPYLSKLEALPSEKARSIAARWIERIRNRPHYAELESRLTDLDKYRIDYEVIAITQDVDPNRIGPLGAELELSITRLLNDEMARVMKESKKRIYSLASVPFASISNDAGGKEEGEEGIEEMRRSVQQLGLKGFFVLSNINGTPIDKYNSFWREAERLNVPVYIHPIDPISNTSRPYEDDFDLMHVFGWPFETTLILSRLAFSGVLETHPRLRILAHHMGGMIPFFAGRINESYGKTTGLVKRDQKIGGLQEGKPAMDLFKQFYYDTAVGGSSEAIRCGLDIFGVDRIVFGTDYPFGPEAGKVRLATYPSRVLDLGLSTEENKKIFEENARRLLGN